MEQDLEALIGDIGLVMMKLGLLNFVGLCMSQCERQSNMLASST